MDVWLSHAGRAGRVGAVYVRGGCPGASRGGVDGLFDANVVRGCMAVHDVGKRGVAGDAARLTRGFTSEK